MFNPDQQREVTAEVQQQLGQPGKAIELTESPDIEATTALDAAWAHWLDCTAKMQTLGFSADALCEASHDIERVVTAKRDEYRQAAETR